MNQCPGGGYLTKAFNDPIFQPPCHLPATGLEVVPSLPWEGDERCALARRSFAILQFDRVGCGERRRAKNSVNFLGNEANGCFINDFNGGMDCGSLFEKTVPLRDFFTERTQ